MTREYPVGIKGATIVSDWLYFMTKELQLRRLNIRQLLKRLYEGDRCLGYEGDRLFIDQVADFFVSPYDEAVYLLRPNGDVMRLNTNQHIALSSTVQVTDWMSITKMGSQIVVAGWNSKSQDNTFVLLNKELEFADRLDISCKTTSRQH